MDKKTLTPEQIKRVLYINDLMMDEVAPSLKNTATRDLSGSIGGNIMPNALPSGNESLFNKKVLYPSIMESFDNKSSLEDMSQESLLKLEEMERMNKMRGYRLLPKVDMPKTNQEIINETLRPSGIS